MRTSRNMALLLKEFAKSWTIVAVLVVASPLSHAADGLSIKGDYIGMGLEAFKAKYSRPVQGNPKHPAPFCSDYMPNKELITLLAEEWHTRANVVTCSTHFPFEKHKGNYATLAGYETDLFIYHFVDGKLYKVTVAFPRAAFSSVRDAFQSKYGQPVSESVETMQNAFGATFSSERRFWSDGIVSLILIERAGTIDRSLLELTDPFVEQEVKSRAPGPRTDDI